MHEGMETSKRIVMYDEKFREWMRDHPGVVDAMRETVKTLETLPEREPLAGKKYDIGAIDIELLGGDKPSDFHYYHLKVSIGNDRFFVKVQTDLEQSSTPVNGADEFKSTIRASGELSQIEWAEVVEPLLGYQEAVNHRKQSYFVSRWRDLPTCSRVLTDLHAHYGTSDNPESKDIIAKLAKLKIVLPEYYDLGTNNMFYDATTKKIVLYDLSYIGASRSRLQKEKR